MATRSQIREAIRAIAAPAGFSTTFNYSPAQIFEDELPALKVFFGPGETEYDFDDDGITEAQVFVEIMLRDPGNIDDALDQKASAVQQLLRENPQLDGLIEGMNRTNFAYDRDSETTIGELQLTYTIQYLDED